MKTRKSILSLVLISSLSVCVLDANNIDNLELIDGEIISSAENNQNREEALKITSGSHDVVRGDRHTGEDSSEFCEVDSSNEIVIDNSSQVVERPYSKNTSSSDFTLDSRPDLAALPTIGEEVEVKKTQPSQVRPDELIITKSKNKPLSKPTITYKQPVYKKNITISNIDSPITTKPSTCDSSYNRSDSSLASNYIQVGGDYAKSSDRSVKTTIGGRLGLGRMYNSALPGLSLGPNMEVFAGKITKNGGGDRLDYYGVELTPKMAYNFTNNLSTFIKGGVHITKKENSSSYKGITYGGGLKYRFEGFNNYTSIEYTNNRHGKDLSDKRKDEYFTFNIGIDF